MPLLSQKEVLNFKLGSIPLPDLKILAQRLSVESTGSVTEIIKRILGSKPEESRIDEFIKQKYSVKIQDRKDVISDEDLKKELLKVQTFSWGVIQGKLDQKIQTEYVRKIVRYEDLLSNVKAKLHDEITNYVICTWFNHWTTVLIEEHISVHSKVVPTLKNIKGIDIFFNGQPFDLKITYLPRKYDPITAINDLSGLAIWMYENQSDQRFGSDNRLFVVLLDKSNPERSWELKRDFKLVFNKIDKFFDTQAVTEKDEIVFSYKKKTYTAISKVLFITK